MSIDVISEGVDALVELNLFEIYYNEFSSQFDGHALSLDDFLQRLEETYSTEMHCAYTWNETPGAFM